MKAAIRTAVLVFVQGIVCSALADVGFVSGNKFTAFPLHGSVTVTCSDGVTVAYSCRDKVLEPSSFDYFVGPEGIDADTISLATIRADGNRRDRAANYNSQTGRSIEPFNLWASNLFQKPLLTSGTNKIGYVLKKGDQIVAQGTTVVTVAQGTGRECSSAEYQSTDPQDCNSQYSVCQQYFEQFNNCR